MTRRIILVFVAAALFAGTIVGTVLLGGDFALGWATAWLLAGVMMLLEKTAPSGGEWWSLKDPR